MVPNPNYYPEPTHSNANALDPIYKVDAYGDLNGGAQTFLNHPLEGSKNFGSDAQGPGSTARQRRRQRDRGSPALQARPSPAIGRSEVAVERQVESLHYRRLDADRPDDVQRRATCGGRSGGCGNPRRDQRNSPAVSAAAAIRNNLGHSAVQSLARTLPPNDQLPKSRAGGTGNIKFLLTHSLGVLNQAFTPAFRTNTMPQTNPPGKYLGDPAVMPGSNVRPFPWLTWNARPYANLMELLLVPASSPDRLFLEFGFPEKGTTLINAYDSTAPGGPPTPDARARRRAIPLSLRAPPEFSEHGR